MVLALLLVVQGMAGAMLLWAGMHRRLVADQRWALEGRLVAASALALVRPHFATGAVLPEGIPWRDGGVRGDGWGWSVTAERWGALVRLTATAERHLPDGRPLAGARATLLLRVSASDTLQRLPSRSRF